MNFKDTPILDLSGSPLQVKSKNIMMSTAIIEALLSNSDEKIDGTEKFIRYQLAERISKGNVELTSEEIVKIKELCGKVLTTLAVGQIYKYLK